MARTAHFALHRAALDVAAAGSHGRAIAESERCLVLPLFAVRELWIGAMVPKRWAKRAVTRNAIKREIYSVTSYFESALPVAAHVVRLRAAFDRTQFVSATSTILRAAVHQELQCLFARATTQPSARTHSGGAT